MSNLEQTLRTGTAEPEASSTAQSDASAQQEIRLTLRRKLILNMVFIAALVVASGASVVGYWDYLNFQRQSEINANSIASTLSQTFVKILLLGDQDAAADATAAMQSFPSIRFAVLYDTANSPLFSYHIDGAAAPAPTDFDTTMWVDDDGLNYLLPVTYQGMRHGTAHIVMTADTFYAWLGGYIKILLALLPLSLAVAVLLSYLFEGQFTRPILRLTEFVQRVSREQDYELKIETREKNEISDLYLGINQLLATIRSTQRSLIEHKQALDAAAIVSVTDADGTITYVNDLFCNISGYSREELIGQNHRIVRSGYHTPRTYKAMWQTISSGQLWHGELCNMDKEGEYYWVDTTIVPFMNDAGTPERYLAVRFPITERKNAELELISAKETLELRVKQRSAELHRSQEQLIESEKMAALGGLVAGISHEVNTPIGIGVTAASHLEEELARLEKDVDSNQITKRQLFAHIGECNDSCRIILSNLSRAADLVRSFKQVATDQSQHEKREFELRSYLDEIVLSLRPKLKRTRHEISINCADDVAMQTYAGAISQVFTNLITNSLRYAFEADDAGQITIDISSPRSNRLHIVFSDNGKGIPADNLRHIFDPFFTTGRGNGGTGLGLHIVYNLVTGTLHGKLRCESQPGNGTRFIIDIPKRIEDSTESAA